MQVLPVLVASLLGMLALIFVLYPLYRRLPSPASTIAAMATRTSSQDERELMARTALQEVELDYQLGNLAETDYRSLRTRYLRRAALAMKSRQEREQELDDMIEEQLRWMKEKAGDVDE